MKNITINGNDYKFEYTIEASLYPKCTEMIMDTFINIGVGEGAAANQDAIGLVDTIKTTVANMPLRTIALFHAGLLEHYDFNEEQSKELLKAYLKESKKSYRDVFTELMEIVAEDNFFDLIGLNQIFAESQTDSKEEKPKKKSNTKPGENTSILG